MFILNSDTKISFKALTYFLHPGQISAKMDPIFTQPRNCFHSKVRTEVSINPPSEEGKSLTEWSVGKTVYLVPHWLSLAVMSSY